MVETNKRGEEGEGEGEREERGRQEERSGARVKYGWRTYIIIQMERRFARDLSWWLSGHGHTRTHIQC